MSSSPPRLRMFAGPNGSGKSTLKTVLPQSLLGIYLNPDEIESFIRKTGSVFVGDFGIEVSTDTDAGIVDFLHHSNLLIS